VVHFKRAISVSFVIHLTILALIIGGILFIRSDDGGSGGRGGAVVTVWLAGPGGRMISGRETSRKKIISAGKREKSITEEARKPENTIGAGKSAGSGSGLGGGGGEAVGSGKGEGIGGGDGGDALLTLIWKRINRAKHYPMMAKKRGAEGTPRVTFSIRKDGEIEWVRLESSCGEKILNKAAISAVKKAAPLPYFPGPITLQIRYSLSD